MTFSPNLLCVSQTLETFATYADAYAYGKNIKNFGLCEKFQVARRFSDSGITYRVTLLNKNEATLNTLDLSPNYPNAN